MDDQNKLQEQQAPEKNTDNAFVRVDRDGSPAMPDNKKFKDEAQERDRNIEAPKK